MIQHLEPHKLATYFPLLEGDEFDQLVKDIEDNGQLEPIVLHDGAILDGVNRYRACQVLDVEPTTKEYEGDDPIRYVISANIRRRHLNESQRAILALEMLPELEKVRLENKRIQAKDQHDGERFGSRSASVDALLGRATTEAANEFGVSMPSVVRAKRIKEQAPGRIPDIMAGKTSVRTVDQELREARAAEKKSAKVEKVEDRKRQEIDNEVKLYLDALKAYKVQLETAIRVAKYGKFSPEGYQFTIRKHDEIRELLDEFEGVNDG